MSETNCFCDMDPQATCKNCTPSLPVPEPSAAGELQMLQDMRRWVARDPELSYFMPGAYSQRECAALLAFIDTQSARLREMEGERDVWKSKAEARGKDGAEARAAHARVVAAVERVKGLADESERIGLYVTPSKIRAALDAK